MIYGDLILENKINRLTTNPLTAMQEYYENEISFLNFIVEYKDECLVTESYNLETLHEGFIGNIIEKIKELIEKFIDWIKSIMSAIKDFFTKDESSGKVGTEKDVKKTIEKVEEKKKEIKDLPKEEKPKKIVQTAVATGLVTKEEVKEIIEAPASESKPVPKMVEVKKLDNSYVDDVLGAMRRESKLLDNAYSLVTRRIPNYINFAKEKYEEVESIPYKEDIDDIKDTLEEYNKSGVTWMGGKRIDINEYIKSEKLDFSTENVLDKLIEEYKDNVQVAKNGIDKVEKTSKEYINQAEKMKQSVQRDSKTYKDANIINDLHKVVNLYTTYAKSGITKYIKAITKFKKQSKAFRNEVENSKD